MYKKKIQKDHKKNINNNSISLFNKFFKIKLIQNFIKYKMLKIRIKNL